MGDMFKLGKFVSFISQSKVFQFYTVNPSFIWGVLTSQIQYQVMICGF